MSVTSTPPSTAVPGPKAGAKAPAGAKATAAPPVLGTYGRVAAWLSKRVEVALTTVDLTLPQYRVLGILAEGSAAASGLADRLAVRRPSITALIDGLVARGLVDRRQEDTDRRRVALRLTDEGVRTLAAADRAVDDYLVSIAGHLSDKEEAMALRSLELWARAMTESRQGPRPAADAAAGTAAQGKTR
ncbi:MAG: MarR family winged helix-turn-helix transcriptional regulator [Acidimicrobiales bacterium]